MDKDLLILKQNKLTKLDIGLGIFDTYIEMDKIVKKYRYKKIQSKIFSSIGINSNNNININNANIFRKSLFKYILIITLIFFSL